MVKSKKIIVGVMSAIFFMAISAFNVYAYDGNAAVSYASTHMASGHTNKGYNCPNSWLCAEFVSNCINAGGIKDIYATGCRTFYNQCAANGTVYTLSKGSASSGAYPVLSSGNGANLVTGDILVSYCPSCNLYLHAALISKTSGGYFYGYEHNANRIDGKIWFSKCSSGHAPTIYGIHLTGGMSDNMIPSIQNVKIVERYKNGFKMQCFVSDNVGVAKVQFPTWESSKTSEGCTWYDGTHIGNGVWEFTFPSAATEGWYTTHIYAWDTSGNHACKGVDTYVDRTQPSISDVYVTDVTADGYRVRCTVTDNYELDRVQFPTWTGYNGQDDIQLNWTTDPGAQGVNCGNNVYEYYVKRSDHNGEFGHYVTHIYAFDKTGNQTSYDAGIINLENVAPIVSDVQIVNRTADSYTVTCKVVDDQSGVARVQFPTWTKENWQDDIDGAWGNSSNCSGKHIGNDVYSFTVKRSDHNNEYGIYYTDIYAYDTLENMCFGGSVSLTLENVPPTFTEITISNQTEDGYTVTCGAFDESGMEKIDVCVWTKANGQDDIMVGNAECIGDNIYSYRVKFSDHSNEFGEYITHVYAYDTLGNSVFCGEVEVENKESDISQNPNNPSDPTDPSNPEEPNNPSNPTDPSNPGEPNNPSNPTDPSNPEDPTKPDTPSSSNTPSGSDTPGAAVKKCNHNYVFSKGSFFDDDAFRPNWRQYKCSKCSDIKTEYYRINGVSVGEVIVIGNLRYVITSNATYQPTVKLEKVTNKNISTLKVADEIEYKSNKFKVTEMSEGLCKNFKKLNKVSLGDNIKVIPKNAFYQCKKLKKVELGLYTKTIQKNAFYGCIVLNNVYFSEVKTIGESAFANCKKLYTVNLSDIQTIGKKAFYNCKNLKNVIITSTKLKSVGTKAFGNISKKAEVYLPESKFKKYKKMFKGKCPSGVTYYKY